MIHGVNTTSSSAEVLAVGETIEMRYQADRLADALDKNNLASACESAGNMLGIPPKDELFRWEDDWNEGMPRHAMVERFVHDKSPSSSVFAKDAAEEFAFNHRPHASKGITADTYEQHMRSLSLDPVNIHLNPAGANYAHELAGQFAEDKRLFRMREGVKQVGIMEFIGEGRLLLYTPYSEYEPGEGNVSGLVACVSFDHNQLEEVRAYFERQGFSVGPSEPPVITKLRQVYGDSYLVNRESLKEHLGLTDELMALETVVVPAARRAHEATVVFTPHAAEQKNETKIMPAPENPPTKQLALGSLVTAEDLSILHTTHDPAKLAHESIEVQMAALGIDEHTPPPSPMEVVQTLREALTLNKNRLQLLFSPQEMRLVEQYLDAQTLGISMPIRGIGRIAETALKMAYDHVDAADHPEAPKRLAALDALMHLHQEK